MPSAQIFISYRRDDSAGHARAVAEALARHFGSESVFIDVDDIGAGLAFDTELEQALSGARVLLVLIGRRWLAAADGGAADAPRRRLDDPNDFVHREVATGLARGLHVVPLLVDGAAMPTELELPPPLRALARRQALAVEHARFAADIERLVAALRRLLGEPTTSDATAGAVATAPALVGTTHRGGFLAVLGVLALSAAAGAWWALRAGTAPAPAPAGVPPTAARPAINGDWQAEVRYAWLSEALPERYSFGGTGSALHGSAGFLRVARGIVEGRIEPDGSLSFVTRSQESDGSGAPRELTHRYRGRLDADTLVLTMQTEGSSSPHTPLEIRARRVGP